MGHLLTKIPVAKLLRGANVSDIKVFHFERVMLPCSVHY